MTLTQTAILTKRVLTIGFAVIFLSLFSWISYKIWYTFYYIPHLPPKIEKPDLRFGLLPKPNFDNTKPSSSNYSYAINTTSGDLPHNFPKIIKIYFIPQLGTTLLAPNRATDLATKFLFPNGPDTSDPTKYKFTDNSGGELNIDLTSGNFKFDRHVSTESANLTLAQSTSTDSAQVSLPPPDAFGQGFKDYLSSKGILDSFLQGGRTNVVYDNPNQRNSNSAIISIWPSDFDSLPIYTPKYDIGLVNALVSKANDEIYKYLKLNFTIWTPDSANFATYPLKSVDDAFKDLQGGQGTIMIQPPASTVSLTDVKLAYFESESYTPYLLPIYVFMGEHFAAYVNALEPQNISQ